LRQAKNGFRSVSWNIPGCNGCIGVAARERLGFVRSLGYLAAVNVVIWVGLFLYLWRLDRRISEAERKP